MVDHVIRVQAQWKLSLSRSEADRVSPNLAEVRLGLTGIGCQEIGLVAFMFFSELLFPYVSLQFPSMFPLLTYSQSFFSLSADYLRHSR